MRKTALFFCITKPGTATMRASNAFQLRGHLPEDKLKLLETFDRIISEVSEEDLRNYRNNLPHL